jgi:DNA-binding transcriptional ArsR family regulator
MANSEASSLTSAGPAETMAEVLRVLGNTARLRMVALLCQDGESPVGEIARKLDLAQAVTSQQLSALRSAGIVKVRRQGGFRFYSLAVPELSELLSCLVSCGRKHGRLTSSEAS